MERNKSLTRNRVECFILNNFLFLVILLLSVGYLHDNLVELVSICCYWNSCSTPSPAQFLTFRSHDSFLRPIHLILVIALIQV